MLKRELGTVRKWIADRGFGFVYSDAGDDIFVHIKAVEAGLMELRKGQRVSYVLGTDRQGRTVGQQVQLIDA